MDHHNEELTTLFRLGQPYLQYPNCESVYQKAAVTFYLPMHHLQQMRQNRSKATA